MDTIYFINGDERNNRIAQEINWALRDIDLRLSELEYNKAGRGKKPEISRAEKMVLLHELGVLDYMAGLGFSQSKISLLLSKILTASASNLEADLSARNHVKSHLRTEENYAFAVQTFKEIKIKAYEGKAQAELDKIEKKKV
jgi:hypothetical protein